MKTRTNRAWFFVLPVVISVAFSALIPLMTVVNYSVQDIFGPGQRVFVGSEWFVDTMRDTDLHDAFLRNLLFSFEVLLIEIALPLLIPWNVVGTIWQIFGRADIGLGGRVLNQLGYEYNYTLNAGDAWYPILLMDVWHWTPLVALLAYAGLRSIPEAYYQAASIDAASRWNVFRFVELPKLRGVLMISLLLRFMDSFMIYTEPFVITGGGPGNATTFLSIYLSKLAVGQFVFCYLFYTVIQRVGRGSDA